MNKNLSTVNIVKFLKKVFGFSEKFTLPPYASNAAGILILLMNGEYIKSSPNIEERKWPDEAFEIGELIDGIRKDVIDDKVAKRREQLRLSKQKSRSKKKNANKN